MKKRRSQSIHVDKGLFMAVMILVLFGLVMQFSASVGVAEYSFGHPDKYFLQQWVYLCAGVLAGVLCYYLVSMSILRKLSIFVMLIGVLALAIVLIPGVGSRINGSLRWIDLGLFNIQPSEIAKLAMAVYLSSFFATVHDRTASMSMRDLLPIVIVLMIYLGLLLLEPDFGSSVVLVMMTTGVLLVSGFSLKNFLFCTAVTIVSALVLVISSPYRLRRLTSFSDPWSDPFDSGFQLSQSLIAFGRGEINGVGLGESVQKYAYLPEAHTDFIFAVIGEELGVMGTGILIMLFLYITLKLINMSKMMLMSHQQFSGYLVMAIAIWFGGQAGINMGVNMGILPTKGITLPFLSYGGSSLVTFCIAMSLVFRANAEMAQSGSLKKRREKPHPRSRRRRRGVYA